MIYYILEQLEKTSSSNEKLEILKAYREDEVFKKVLYYTYNPLINFYTKRQVEEFREYETAQEGKELDIQNIFPLLETLSSRGLTGISAIEYIEDVGRELHYLDRIVLNRIIGRDLRCGISAKSINKVFSNLIPEIPYMRCSLSDKLSRISYPAIVEKKEDSIFVNVVYKSGDIKFFTRNGTEFDLISLKEELFQTFHEKDIDEDIVIHGELLVGSESRKVASGLINSLIKKDQTIESLQKKIEEKSGKTSDKLVSELTTKLAEYDETDKKLRIVMWDVVSYNDWKNGESDEIYHERFKYLFTFESDHVKVVEHEIVSNYSEALDFYKKQIDAGYEGAVLKNFKMKWKNHTSPEQIKIKAERETELKIVGCVEGTGKYEGGLGAVVCQSSCGKLLVNVGSGFSDSERGFERVDENDSSKGLKLLGDFDKNSYIGKIISVKFNEVIESETKDTYSLFLPRFVCVRDDKNEADDFETIKKL